MLYRVTKTRVEASASFPGYSDGRKTGTVGVEHELSPPEWRLKCSLGRPERQIRALGTEHPPPVEFIACCPGDCLEILLVDCRTLVRGNLTLCC